LEDVQQRTKKLKNLFQFSFFILLLAASSVVISIEQSFSQLPEQDNLATEPTGFLTYNNATYGITMQYPSDWTVDNTDFPDDGVTQIVGFYSLLDSRLDKYAERLWIAQDNLPLDQDFDLAEYAEQIVTDYEATLVDFSVDEIDTEIDSQTAGLGNIDDSPAYRIVYTETLEPENIELKTMEIGTVVENRLYVINYYSEATSYDRYLPIIEQIISSIQLSSGTDPAQQQQGEWLVYENATYGVRMLYPSTWTQEDTNSTQQGLISVSEFFSPTEANGDYAFVEIYIEDLPPGMNVEDYLNASIDAYTSGDYQIISSGMGNFTLAGMPAYTLEATFTDSEFGPQNMLEVGTIIGNNAYYIRYIVDPPIYQKYLLTIEQMISSIELSNDTALTGAPTGGEGGGGGDQLEGLQGGIGRTPGAAGSNQTGGGEGGGGGDQLEGLRDYLRGR
jgi:hypothetical protein